MTPAELVAEAERVTNQGTLEEALAFYAADAVVDTVVEGGRDVRRGHDEIRRSLESYLPGARRLGLRVRKTLVAEDGDVVVAGWTGAFGDGDGVRGIEWFRVDEDGLVTEHRLFGFFDVRPAASPRAALRLLTGHPRIALTMLVATLRAGRQRQAAGSGGGGSVGSSRDPQARQSA